MKRINLHFILLLLFSKILFSQASSVITPSESDIVIKRLESFSISLLESDDLEKREAFRSKSIAKVVDLYNYLNIIGNLNYNNDIRIHTTSLVKKMLIKEATINDFLVSQKTITMHLFLDKILKSEEKIQFIISNINLKYHILNYSLTIHKGDFIMNSIKITQPILWENKLKMFGNTSKEVLTSSLGSITID